MSKEPATQPNELTCQELVQLITDYLEGTLPPAQQAGFEAHLAHCHGCRLYLEQMQQTIALVGKLAPATLSQAEQAALLAAFRAWQQRDSTRSGHSH
jgi:anti-sigma factor RsiW